MTVCISRSFRSSFLVLISLALMWLFAACEDGGRETTITIEGTPISEATLIAAFADLAEQRPRACDLLDGLTGTEAYNKLLAMLADNLNVTPTTVPRSEDSERAGDLLLRECRERSNTE